MRLAIQNLANLEGVSLTKKGILVDSTKVVSVIDYLSANGLIGMFSTEWIPVKDRLFSAIKDDLKEVAYEEFVEELPEEFSEESSDDVTLDVNAVLKETIHDVLEEFKDRVGEKDFLENLGEELYNRVSGVLSVEKEPFEEFSEEDMVFEELPEEELNLEEELPEEELNLEEELPEEELNPEEELPEEEFNPEESFISGLINAVSGAGAYYKIFLEGDGEKSSVVVQVEDNDLSEEVKTKISDELKNLGFADLVGDWKLEEVDDSGNEYWVLRSVDILKDGVSRTVRHGKKKIEVEKKHEPASDEQKEALDKARKKAHTPQAERERRKSNDVRKRSDW